MAKILIVGLGDIGTRLAATLLAQGHQVHGLRRSAVAVPGVQLLQADVTRPETLVLPPGLDYMYVILTPGEYSDESYRRTYVEGLGNLLAALGGQALRRLFFVSSTAVYAQDNGEWVDENSPAEPIEHNGKRLLEAENLLRASPFKTTTLRFAGIYGPGRLRLLKWVQSGKPVVAEPPQWSNRIHIEDCVGLLAFLLEKDAAGVALDEIYIGVDNEPVPQHVVLDWIAQQLGLPPVPHAVGTGTAQNKRLSNQRSRALGFDYRYADFTGGYSAVLAGAAS
jgi:nucleoside-diphosphate-sugar epimerase